jgi:hypothetical protein
MASIDLKRKYKESYSARVGKPSVVEMTPRPFLMVDGAGDPNTAPEYASAVAALYPIAYAIRASIKTTTGDAYSVLPLEGLWWADDMEQFSADSKGDWKWTMMIGLPEVVDAAGAVEAIAETTLNKRLVAGDAVRYEVFDEGLSAQVMHIGPYSAEAPTIEMLHEFITEQGLTRRGRHHEIYLSDPRRTAPEKLKTIIRQPAA